MPVRRILSLVFAVAAAVAVLSALAGLDGGPATTAGVLALLTSALGAILFIRRPLARWALAAGIVVAAAAWTVREVYFEQVREAEYAAMVLLVIGVAALLVGTVALPQFHRPAGLTAAACPVALVPVTVVAVDAADERALSPFVDLVALYRQLAPGLLATVLAGLVLVLVVSRADRWFLAPAGAALLQSAVAQEAWGDVRLVVPVRAGDSVPLGVPASGDADGDDRVRGYVAGSGDRCGDGGGGLVDRAGDDCGWCGAYRGRLGSRPGWCGRS